MHVSLATIFVSFLFAILFQIPSAESSRIAPIFRNIYNGDSAGQREFPFIAALFKCDKEARVIVKDNFRCGATIITPQHLLSAAHCFKNIKETEKIIARVGLSNLFNYVAQFEVKKIIRHPKYDSETTAHDIAILELRTRMTFDDRRIKAGCLPKGDQEYHKKKPAVAVAAGWGLTQEELEKMQDDLRKVHMTLISNEACKTQADHKLRKYITENTLCAGGPKDVGGICQGDSGGPLILFEDDTIIGTGSQIIPCQNFQVPQVFTRFSKYMSWIKRETKNERLCIQK